MRSTTTTIFAILSFCLTGAGMALADIGTGAGAAPPTTAERSVPKPSTPRLILSQARLDAQQKKESAEFFASLSASCLAHCQDQERDCISSKKPKSKRSASEAFFQCQPQLNACFTHCDKITKSK